MLSVRPSNDAPPIEGAVPAAHPYFPVSPFKFAAMSVCTFGLYEYYWAYQQWKRIRDREGEDLSPFWRAFFLPLWMFSLMPRINANATARGIPVAWSGGLLAVLFFLLSALWRLPDPWWLVSMLTFVPVLPVVSTVEEVNRSAGSHEDHNHGFSATNFVGGVVGGLLVLLAVLGTFFPE